MRPREIYERPANLFVADFMGLVNKLRGTVVGRDGKTLAIDVGGHRLLATGRGAGRGEAVAIAIRPEAIVFGNTGGNAGKGRANRLKGTVTEATFLGNIVDYQVDIGGLVLRVQGDRRGFREVGSRVVLTVPVADCVAMADEADGPQTQPQSSQDAE